FLAEAADREKRRIVPRNVLFFSFGDRLQAPPELAVQFHPDEEGLRADEPQPILRLQPGRPGLNFAGAAGNVKAEGRGGAAVSARILFVPDDVFFWARVQAAARSAGSDARRIGDEEGLAAAAAEGGVSRVLFDLGVRAVDPRACAVRFKAVSPTPELVAFGAHVDEA